MSIALPVKNIHRKLVHRSSLKQEFRGAIDKIFVATHLLDIREARREAFGGNLSNFVDVSVGEKKKLVPGVAVGPFFFGVVEAMEETFTKLVK